jgi:hypothetical protein
MKALLPPAIKRGGELRTCDVKEVWGSDVGDNEITFGKLSNFMIDFTR